MKTLIGAFVALSMLATVIPADAGQCQTTCRPVYGGGTNCTTTCY